MSLKAFEDACTRAELFGQPLPDRDEFLSKHKHLDVVEFEEVEIKTAEARKSFITNNENMFMTDKYMSLNILQNRSRFLISLLM